MSARSHSGKGGFTLIDVAIMLVVLGLLAASLLSSSKTDRESSNLTATRDRIASIQAALDFFVRQNGYVPCPALRNLAEGASGYRKADCATSSGTSVTDVAISGGGTVRIGVLPSRELGLPDSTGVDAWGNVFSYAMVKELGTATGYAGFTTAATSGVINIRLNVPAAATQLVTRAGDVTAWIVISHGEDGRGAWRPNGTASLACGSTQDDRTNCTNSGAFADFAINDAVDPGASAWFYDLVRYRRLIELAK